MNQTLTFPKHLVEAGELVVLPRSEYEAYLTWQKNVRTFKPTAAQKKDLIQARRDFKEGKFVRIEDLKI